MSGLTMESESPLSTAGVVEHESMKNLFSIRRMLWERQYNEDEKLAAHIRLMMRGQLGQTLVERCADGRPYVTRFMWSETKKPFAQNQPSFGGRSPEWEILVELHALILLLNLNDAREGEYVQATQYEPAGKTLIVPEVRGEKMIEKEFRRRALYFGDVPANSYVRPTQDPKKIIEMWERVK